VGGITVTVFDVPNEPPPVSSAPETKIELTPASIPDTPSRPIVANDSRREQINEVLARAVRNLSEAPAAAPGSAITPLGVAAPQPDPKVFGVVSKLGEAMRIAREARDDKDLAKAEAIMRSVRQEMDATCDKAGGGGPLCQSAEQIRSLGY
jgi:hypothetical protein